MNPSPTPQSGQLPSLRPPQVVPGKFYKRKLPKEQVAFSSPEGKKLFCEALADGQAEVFFPLIEQFRTQDEIAFCGLTTLTMVLNALRMDPWRAWKGPWRWYTEQMLDCCADLEVAKQGGITFDTFVCLARCNGLKVEVFRGGDSIGEDFRAKIAQVCSGEVTDKYIVASYSRKALKQTGDGHFSPIGAYHRESDRCLVLDVARFKYPPHWAKVEDIIRGMNMIDKDTGKPRGFLVLARDAARNTGHCKCPLQSNAEMIRQLSMYPHSSINDMINALVAKVRSQPFTIGSDGNSATEKGDLVTPLERGFLVFLRAVEAIEKPIMGGVFLAVSAEGHMATQLIAYTCENWESCSNCPSGGLDSDGARAVCSLYRLFRRIESSLRIPPLWGPEPDSYSTSVTWEASAVARVWVLVFLLLPDFILKELACHQEAENTRNSLLAVEASAQADARPSAGVSCSSTASLEDCLASTGSGNDSARAVSRQSSESVHHAPPPLADHLGCMRSALQSTVLVESFLCEGTPRNKGCCRGHR